MPYHSDEGQFLLPQLADLLPGESPSPHLLDPADGEDGGEALLGDLSLLCGRRLLPPDVLHEFGPQAALAGALVPLQDQESLVDAHMLTWRLGKKERINAFAYSSITLCTALSRFTFSIFRATDSDVIQERNIQSKTKTWTVDFVALYEKTICMNFRYDHLD